MTVRIGLCTCPCRTCGSVGLVLVASSLTSLVALLSLAYQQILKVGHALEEYLWVIAWLPGVCNGLTSTLDVTLEDKIVSGSNMIVLVCLNALASIVNINVMLF